MGHRGSRAGFFRHFPMRYTKSFDHRSIYSGSIKGRIVETFVKRTGQGKEAGWAKLLLHICLMNGLPIEGCQITSVKDRATKWAIVTIRGEERWSNAAYRHLNNPKNKDGFASAGGILSFRQVERAQAPERDPMEEALKRVYRQEDTAEGESSQKRQREEYPNGNSGVTPENKKDRRESKDEEKEI